MNNTSNDTELNEIADKIESYLECGKVYMAYKYASLYITIYKYWYGR